MDLSYVTERIIALWVPGDVSPVAYRQGQQKAAHMLQTKHGNNYMVSLRCFGVRKKGCVLAMLLEFCVCGYLPLWG